MYFEIVTVYCNHAEADSYLSNSGTVIKSMNMKKTREIYISLLSKRSSGENIELFIIECPKSILHDSSEILK